MKQFIQSVTKAVPALPVAQERAQMSPERKAEQRNSTLTAVVCWAIGAAIIAWTPWPAWWAAVVIVYGIAAFDFRLFKDILSFVGQLAVRLKDLKKETTS